MKKLDGSSNEHAMPSLPGFRSWILLAGLVAGCRSRPAPPAVNAATAPSEPAASAAPSEANCDAVRACVRARLPSDYASPANFLPGVEDASFVSCFGDEKRGLVPVGLCTPFTFATDSRNGKEVEVYERCSGTQD